MGLFNKKKEAFVSPMSGKLVSLDQVPDEVFSQRMMGDGFAVDLTSGRVTAPMSGTITVAFPTKHAIGLKNKDGLEILIHIGMDTVELNGKGFTSYISEGKKVKQGDPLVDVDIAFVKENGKPVISPVIFVNGEKITVLKEGNSLTNGEENFISIE